MYPYMHLICKILILVKVQNVFCFKMDIIIIFFFIYFNCLNFIDIGHPPKQMYHGQQFLFFYFFLSSNQILFGCKHFVVLCSLRSLSVKSCIKSLKYIFVICYLMFKNRFCNCRIKVLKADILSILDFSHFFCFYIYFFQFLLRIKTLHEFAVERVLYCHTQC